VRGSHCVSRSEVAYFILNASNGEPLPGTLGHLRAKLGEKSRARKDDGRRVSRGPSLKVLTVVGARPQFVKLAPLGRVLGRRLNHVVVHTGQHYDPELSDRFFEQLRIPSPEHHLGIGSGSHGRMTGRMLVALERAILEERPGLVLVVGDTNSTLAGALAAAKLGIPLGHVEAGLRSFDASMPEEINRRVTDHLSQLLFCPTQTAVSNLRAEGIVRGVHLVGDVMMDAILQNLPRVGRLGLPKGISGPYYVFTLHRQGNVDRSETLMGFMDALERLEHSVIFPVHPRTRRRLRELGWRTRGRVHPLPALPYLEMLRLVQGATALLTDSGGLQKEAFVLGTPCVTLRESTEWTETLVHGANRLAGTSPARMLRALRSIERRRPRWKVTRVYGEGRAAEATVDVVVRFLTARGQRT